MGPDLFNIYPQVIDSLHVARQVVVRGLYQVPDLLLSDLYEPFYQARVIPAQQVTQALFFVNLLN